MAKSLLIFLIIFSLFYQSRSLPSDSVSNAVRTLLNSGYIAMSLTLDLIPPSLFSDRRSVTIFAAPDDAFANSGQPSLSLLEYHCSPLAFSYDGLRSLPFGTKIPTMSFQLPLIVTTTFSDEYVSLNNVSVTGSPLFDDGSLVVFAVKKFFDPTFTLPLSIRSPSSDPGCLVSSSYVKTLSDSFSFSDACGTMKSFGFTAMASYLDLQLPGVHNETSLTVFAPDDDVLAVYAGNFSEYSSLFLRHVLPCKLSWTELTSLNGAELRTYLNGFTVNVSRSDLVRLNGVVVTYPDLYTSERLAVHGLGDVLAVSEQGSPGKLEGDSYPEIGSYDDSQAPDGEF